jgi:hypothetical protein
MCIDYEHNKAGTTKGKTVRYHLETRTAGKAWTSQGSWGTERTARQHCEAAATNTGPGVTIRVAAYDRFEVQPTVNPIEVLAVITTNNEKG